MAADAVNGPLPAIPTPLRGKVGDEDRLVELHCTDDEDQPVWKFINMLMINYNSLRIHEHVISTVGAL